MASNHLLIEDPKPGLRVVRLNRPEVMNALVIEMVEEINATFAAIARDPSCRVVIITGSGRGFCSGQDMNVANQRNTTTPSTLPERLSRQERFSGMAAGIRACPQPVIAAVNGPAAGAGMAIALAADIRLCSPNAKFLVAAVKIGLSAGESGLSYHLPRLIGMSRAAEILLTGRPVDAAEAERIGLVNRVVESADLLPAATAIADQIIANSPFSVAHTKRMMWENVDADSLGKALDLENRTQILAGSTNDYKEATRAFVEKRPPNYTGT
jgi:enoyl-CoA hydratase